MLRTTDNPVGGDVRSGGLFSGRRDGTKDFGMAPTALRLTGIGLGNSATPEMQPERPRAVDRDLLA